MHSFAQPTDEVVAIVDNSVILKSDLEQGMAEAAHELQAQKKKKKKKEVPPQQYLQFQVLDQLILRQAQLEQVKKNMASNLMRKV